ncbi:HupE/UreJ family protein [Bosea sp. (in: a-proteobacteria)]|uniref:HupE/UreJ family protein n=1 Tax=Bosea sp. (in: a-proteobacteria) TaxID=1871050 RepID=UPI00261EF80D|nr:HupE/UreJ family protein [Bosea sp. (in: a-proteobacteria)]MCO5089797.1 HupE/UreJ family protein [Bosea sp. (in: a-proteobacteria)]
MKRLSIALILSAAAASPAFAHVNPAEHGSFAAGFSHPLLGADHVLAMLGVGLWAFLVGGRAVWAIPSAFVGTMMLGFGAALAGIGLPFVEPTIAASVVVIGLLALVAAQVPVVVGIVVVGFFALFHGYAHGGEMGEATSLSFMSGFALATALLHAVGIGIGLAGNALSRRGRIAARIAGGLTALGGLWLVAGA